MVRPSTIGALLGCGRCVAASCEVVLGTDVTPGRGLAVGGAMPKELTPMALADRWALLQGFDVD